MGTRSIIGKLNKDGTVTGIYCHWDGYPEYNGRILRESYNSTARVSKLLQLGDLSSLGPKIGRKHPFDDRDPRWEGMCRAYKRDRGEKNCEAIVYKDRNEFLDADRGQEFTYLWDGSKWLCWKAWGNKEDIDLYAVDELA